MSTRASYTFIDHVNDKKYYVYKHHDGYPTGAALAIEKTLNSGYIWEFPRFEADEFAAGFVAANKDAPGGIRLMNNDDDISGCQYDYQISWDDIDGVLKIWAFLPGEWKPFIKANGIESFKKKAKAWEKKNE